MKYNEALLTTLCFLHAVQPMKIAEIKLSAIDVERKIISMSDIPNKVVAKEFVKSAVQSFSGFGPQTLRITCLQEMASLKGSNFSLKKSNADYNM